MIVDDPLDEHPVQLSLLSDLDEVQRIALPEESGLPDKERAADPFLLGCRVPEVMGQYKSPQGIIAHVPLFEQPFLYEAPAQLGDADRRDRLQDLLYPYLHFQAQDPGTAAVAPFLLIEPGYALIPVRPDPAAERLIRTFHHCAVRAFVAPAGDPDELLPL